MVGVRRLGGILLSYCYYLDLPRCLRIGPARFEIVAAILARD